MVCLEATHHRGPRPRLYLTPALKSRNFLKMSLEAVPTLSEDVGNPS